MRNIGMTSRLVLVSSVAVLTMTGCGTVAAGALGFPSTPRVQRLTEAELLPVPVDSVKPYDETALKADGGFFEIALLTPTTDQESLTDSELITTYSTHAASIGANGVAITNRRGRRELLAVKVISSLVRAYGGRSNPTSAGGSTASPGGSTASPGGPVHVRGYCRRDGTCVRPHTRRRPRG